VRVSVDVGVGSGVEGIVADGEGVEVGAEVGDGTGVKVADGDGTATVGTAVSVGEGSTWANISCSPMPRATATKSVSATRVAAMSPLKSGPSPRALLL